MIILKNTEEYFLFLAKFILLILFVFLSFYKIEVNLLIIILVLFFFSFINSLFLFDRKIKFDLEVFSFQIITAIFLERTAIFYWREVPEKIFYNYNYVKILFLVVSVFVFMFLKYKSDNKLLKKYFNIIFLYLVIVQDIFDIGYLAVLSFIFSVYETMLTYFMIDIMFIMLLNFFLAKKNKNFFHVYFFLILCIFIRYITNTLGGTL